MQRVRSLQHHAVPAERRGELRRVRAIAERALKDVKAPAHLLLDAGIHPSHIQRRQRLPASGPAPASRRRDSVHQSDAETVVFVGAPVDDVPHLARKKMIGTMTSRCAFSIPDVQATFSAACSRGG